MVQKLGRKYAALEQQHKNYVMVQAAIVFLVYKTKRFQERFCDYCLLFLFTSECYTRKTQLQLDKKEFKAWY